MRYKIVAAGIGAAALTTAAVGVTLVRSGQVTLHNAAMKLDTFDVPAPPEVEPPGMPSPVMAMEVTSPADAVADSSDDTPAAATDPIKVAVPRVAYHYKYGFTLAGSAIAGAQRAHVALCDRLGPAHCQVLAMESKAGDDSAAEASLQLRVDSALARRFGTALEAAIGRAGGHADSRSISAEDVSKDMVDTAARLKQRELLVARLTEVLRTHNGKVGELVEAERSVAAAQEEIDQARGWLDELQRRVAMSTIDIAYSATAPQPAPVGNTIGDSIAGSAASFAMAIGGLARALIFLAPWLLIAAFGWWGIRRYYRRWVRTTEGSRAQPQAV